MNIIIVICHGKKTNIYQIELYKQIFNSVFGLVVFFFKNKIKKLITR